MTYPYVKRLSNVLFWILLVSFGQRGHGFHQLHSSSVFSASAFAAHYGKNSHAPPIGTTIIRTTITKNILYNSQTDIHSISNTPSKNGHTRLEFLSNTRMALKAAAALLSTQLIQPRQTVLAFDGGVGGLGKTKPSTGVVFMDLDNASPYNNDGNVFRSELLAPDGMTPVLVSFEAPWPLLRTSSSIESRAMSDPDSAFVLVAKAPSSASNGGGTLSKAFFIDNVFSSNGKYGAYGTPTDVKIKSLTPNMYSVSFTTLTPAMRESERKVYISTSTVGDGIFMLVTGSTAVRFSKLEKRMTKVAESFHAIPAPKTNLRRTS